MQSTYFSIWKDLLYMNRYSTGRYKAVVLKCKDLS